ncbi:MAG TPA: hypothetical protein P5121_35620 [Caldilineaceae bacterium]|nr:hypothetical protein [Caldilineaceae bacterium]
MTYKTDQTTQDWIFVWASFVIAILFADEQWPRLLGIGFVLAAKPLYWYLWRRTVDVPGLIGVTGIAVLMFLLWIHPGLPFFLFAAIVFFGFIIAPMYLSLRRTKQQQHKNEQTAP